MNIIARCAAIAFAMAVPIAPAAAQKIWSRAGTITVMPANIRSSHADRASAQEEPAAVSMPSGSLFFSTTEARFSHGKGGNTVALDLRYDNTETGVQGLEITIEIPGTTLSVSGVKLGRAITAPANWTLDYTVKRSRQGSTVKIIAFGRDTLTRLDAGMHRDVISISFDIDDAEPTKPGVGIARPEITITGVASALAHSLGHSAGIVAGPERASMRFRIQEAGGLWGDPDVVIRTNVPGTFGVAGILNGLEAGDDDDGCTPFIPDNIGVKVVTEQGTECVIPMLR